MISLFQSGNWHPPTIDAAIYSIDKPPAEPDNLNAAMGLLNIERPNRNDWKSNPLVAVLARGPHLFTYFKASGAVQYIDRNRWQTEIGSSFPSISDDKAIEVTWGIAERLSLANQAVFKPLRVTRLNAGLVSKENREPSVRVIDVGVVFQRMIDDLPVEGPGGKIVIYIDHELQMTGFERLARPIYGMHERVTGWRTREEVEEEVQKHWGLTFGQELVLEDVRFGYAELDRTQYQDLIQPVYVLDMRIQNTKDGRRRCEHFVTAAVNGVGRLMPPFRAKPQATRTS